MPKTKHSPGPWQFEQHGSHVSDSKGRALSMTQNSGFWTNPETKHFERWDRTEAEIEANGKLIACAPEMLEALQAFVIRFGGKYELDANIAEDRDLMRAIDVIAKATGVAK